MTRYINTENARLYVSDFVCEQMKKIPTADVVELSKVKEVIMQYIAEQTVSKYPTAELCKASRMGAEGVIYALEDAFDGDETE